MTLEPLDDYLVVQTTEDESETRAGLILPASAETQCSAGIVTAVGPDAEGIAPGDKVLFLKEAGNDVRFAGNAVKVLRRHELIARVHD
jgi:co-chaperonin GroES (HSP10)